MLAGGTAKDLTNYSQDFASNEYGNVYARSLQQYQQAYNQFQQQQANTFNRLSATSGGGQVAAGQLGQQGQAAATGVSNINLTTGAQQGQDLQNAGAATASGYVGGANALTSGINNYTGMMTLQQLLQGGGGGGGGVPPVVGAAGGTTADLIASGQIPG